MIVFYGGGDLKMQKLMIELKQLQSRYKYLGEDWERIGFKIIERELLEEIVKRLDLNS